jgi:methionyl-tRNA formyltransferase
VDDLGGEHTRAQGARRERRLGQGDPDLAGLDVLGTRLDLQAADPHAQGAVLRSAQVPSPQDERVAERERRRAGRLQERLLEGEHEEAALADRLQPDVIAVFGTSLIRGPLLEKGRIGIFNLHGGLSPRYRGADCTFWALYNGEPDQVGCTLHRIDSGIDTGALIAHVCPAVREGDDELTLFWRAVRDSAQTYSELLDRLERGERLGRPQPDKGRLYQVKQRGWREERRLAARSTDLLRGLSLPPRVHWFEAQ